MRTLYLLTLMLGTSLCLRAQVLCMPFPWGCVDTIPSLATVVTGTQTYTQGESCFWVCPGDTLNIIGPNNTIYAEEGAAVYVYGGENFVEIKENGYVFIDSTSLACGVWYDSTTTVVDLSPNSTKTGCGAVTFNYDDAPPAGCAVGFVDQPTLILTLYPNPANEFLLLPGGRILSVELIDIAGYVHHPERSGYLLDVASVAPGLYFVRLFTADGITSVGSVSIVR